MAVVFLRIRVADFSKWKAAFQETEPLRRASGITFREMYKDAGYWNGVLLVLDCEDVEKAMDYYTSDEQRARMAKSGLESTPELWLGNDFPE